jgi:uncharacterized membrane protein YphA (DoxX/SURF4 family)
MKTASLFLLRLSVALLILVWGIDKIVNPAHGAGVAERFYFGFLSAESLMPALGVAEIALAVLVALGVLRSFTLPALAAITGMTLIGVWRSVLDPLGLYLGRTNILFFPSLIIFFAVLVLMAFRAEDRWALQPRG